MGHLFRMLGLTAVQNGFRWISGVRGFGHPYGERLGRLLLLHIEEIRAATPLSGTMAFDKSIDWERFWLEQEQEETLQRMAS